MAKLLGKSADKTVDASNGGTDAPPTYLPPHALMKKLLHRETKASGEDMVTLPAAAFNKILEAAAANLFDEKTYLDRYADIRGAVKGGSIPSGLEHFIRDGYLEGRQALSFGVDEAWYLKTYPDVALAIQAGKVRNAAHHFELFGYVEGRVPHRELQRTVAEWRELERKHAGKS